MTFKGSSTHLHGSCVDADGDGAVGDQIFLDGLLVTLRHVHHAFDLHVAHGGVEHALLLLLRLVRVFVLEFQPADLLDGLEPVVHVPAIARAVGGVAVEQFLLGVSFQLACLDGMKSLNVAGHREAPAGPAVALILDGRDSALLGPVELLRKILHVDVGDVSDGITDLVVPSLAHHQTRLVQIFLLGEVGEGCDSVLGGALLVFVQHVDLMEILLEDSMAHLQLQLVGVPPVIFLAEVLEQNFALDLARFHLAGLVGVEVLVTAGLGTVEGPLDALRLKANAVDAFGFDLSPLVTIDPRTGPDVDLALPRLVAAGTERSVDLVAVARHDLPRHLLHRHQLEHGVAACVQALQVRLQKIQNLLVVAVDLGGRAHERVAASPQLLTLRHRHLQELVSLLVVAVHLHVASVGDPNSLPHLEVANHVALAQQKFHLELHQVAGDDLRGGFEDFLNAGIRNV